MPSPSILARRVLLCCAATLLLGGCSREAGREEGAPAGTLVSVTEARVQDVPVLLGSIGRLESRASPLVAAEVDGRVLEIRVDEGAAVAAGATLAELDATTVRLQLEAARAEAGRIGALLANAERRAQRLRELRGKGSISQEALDDAEAQLKVLVAQREAVQAQLRIAEDQHTKTVVRAPLAGRVQKRLVSTGDFVKRGTPLFEIATSGSLRAMLPFPESLAPQLAPGLAVRMSSPLAPGKEASGVITELRPAVGATNRALWAIVDLENPGDWRPDATVRAEVTVGTHANAVVVPEQSLVRRPAGEVVYVIADGRAAQRIVTVGERLDGLAEITGGLAGGERIALEGAAYLSDGAPVRIAGN